MLFSANNGAFWIDPQVIADFKETIAFLVNRVNAHTGAPFKDDKAILGWETGNELEAGYARVPRHTPSSGG